jgi:hypothetical protein
MEDNQTTIKIIHNPENRKRIRYIDIRHLFIIDYTRFMDGIGLINELLSVEKSDVSV